MYGASRTASMILLSIVMLGAAGCVSTREGAGGRSGMESASSPRTDYYDGGRHVYFDFADPSYDDKGHGGVLYPLDFENDDGYLDLRRFCVLDGGDDVIFRLYFRRPIPLRRRDGSTEPRGWWLHMIDIYVDKDHRKGSGHTEALPGRNVVFDDESAWEKMILVVPEDAYLVEKLMENRTSDLELMAMRKDVIVARRVYPKGYMFEVRVPKYELGEPTPRWGYQVLVCAYNSTHTALGQFLEEDVEKFPTATSFGGGDDYDGDPNVIDLLAPSARLQYEWLSDYVSSPYPPENRYAKIRCLYAAQAGQPHFSAPRPVPAGTRRRPDEADRSKSGDAGAPGRKEHPAAPAAVNRVDTPDYEVFEEGGF